MANHWVSNFSIPLISNVRLSTKSEGIPSLECSGPVNPFEIFGLQISMVAVTESPGLYISLSVWSLKEGVSLFLTAQSPFLSGNQPTLPKKENPWGSFSDISSTLNAHTGGSLSLHHRELLSRTELSIWSIILSITSFHLKGLWISMKQGLCPPLEDILHRYNLPLTDEPFGHWRNKGNLKKQQTTEPEIKYNYLIISARQSKKATKGASR